MLEGADSLVMEVEKLRVEKDELSAKVDELNATLEAMRQEIEQLRGARDNLMGERNLTPDSGFIEVDRSMPTHPVVRFRADCLPESNGSKEYIPGDDTNIVFTPTEDGKVKVDVYWKA